MSKDIFLDAIKSLGRSVLKHEETGIPAYRVPRMFSAKITKYLTKENTNHVDLTKVMLPFIKELFPQAFPAPEINNVTKYLREQANINEQIKWGILSTLLCSSTFKSTPKVTDPISNEYNGISPRFFAMMREIHGTPYSFWDQSNDDWKNYLHKELFFVTHQDLLWSRFSTLEARTRYRNVLLEKLGYDPSSEVSYNPSAYFRKASPFGVLDSAEFKPDVDIVLEADGQPSGIERKNAAISYGPNSFIYFYCIMAGIYLGHPVNAHKNHMTGPRLDSDPALQPQISDAIITKPKEKVKKVVVEPVYNPEIPF